MMINNIFEVAMMDRRVSVDWIYIYIYYYYYYYFKQMLYFHMVCKKKKTCLMSEDFFLMTRNNIFLSINDGLVECGFEID